jgi:uncharacterized membrane protein YfcA
MTLVLGIPPPVARDFSMMIQSVGMSAASFTIVYQQIVIDWTCIFWCSLGGLLGCPVSLAWIAPHLEPPVASPPRDSDPQELLLGPKKYLLL